MYAKYIVLISSDFYAANSTLNASAQNASAFVSKQVSEENFRFTPV
jgi:hypothetical protein